MILHSRAIYNNFYNKWIGKEPPNVNNINERSWRFHTVAWELFNAYMTEIGCDRDFNCDMTGYVDDIWKNRRFNGILDYCQEVPYSKRKKGDIVVFKSTVSGLPFVAIVHARNLFDSEDEIFCAGVYLTLEARTVKYDYTKETFNLLPYPTVFRPKILL